MSQESTTTINKKPRRTRQQRHRPILVTATEPEGNTLPALPARHTDALSATPEITSAAAASPRRLPRLPNFFSKVETPAEESTTPEAEVRQARLARATATTATKKAGTKAEAATDTKKEEAKAAKPVKAAPPKLFKTRHIIGMAIYLLGAQFVLPHESEFAKQLGIERTLFKFPYLGFPVTVSFVLNIATLLLLLYALVKLDLLPSSLTMASQQAKARTTGGNTNPNNATPKIAPPVMKQGVQGEHDNLYQAYRTNQRRDKRR